MEKLALLCLMTFNVVHQLERGLKQAHKAHTHQNAVIESDSEDEIYEEENETETYTDPDEVDPHPEELERVTTLVSTSAYKDNKLFKDAAEKIIEPFKNREQFVHLKDTEDNVRELITLMRAFDAAHALNNTRFMQDATSLVQAHPQHLLYDLRKLFNTLTLETILEQSGLLDEKNSAETGKLIISEFKGYNFPTVQEKLIAFLEGIKKFDTLVKNFGHTDDEVFTSWAKKIRTQLAIRHLVFQEASKFFEQVTMLVTSNAWPKNAEFTRQALLAIRQNDALEVVEIEMNKLVDKFKLFSAFDESPYKEMPLFKNLCQKIIEDFAKGSLYMPFERGLPKNVPVITGLQQLATANELIDQMKKEPFFNDPDFIKKAETLSKRQNDFVSSISYLTLLVKQFQFIASTKQSPYVTDEMYTLNTQHILHDLSQGNMTLALAEKVFDGLTYLMQYIQNNIPSTQRAQFNAQARALCVKNFDDADRKKTFMQVEKVYSVEKNITDIQELVKKYKEGQP